VERDDAGSWILRRINDNRRDMNQKELKSASINHLRCEALATKSIVHALDCMVEIEERSKS
jgi:hypothetical protein